MEAGWKSYNAWEALMWKVVFSSECAQEEKEEQEFGGPVEISVKEKTPSAVQKYKRENLPVYWGIIF